MTQVENIIKFTEAAYAHIQSLIKKQTTFSLFRLSIKKTGCSGYMYQPEVVENPKENDIVVKIFVELTVAIDIKSLDMIKGTVVDYIEKQLGQYQLQFNNPNAVMVCGCGESFHLKKE